MSLVNRSSRCYLLLLITLLLVSCQADKQREVTRGFYHWKTNLNLSSVEQNTLDSLKAEYLYTRFFEVTLNQNGEPQPSAIINFGQSLPHQSIIPTVYITVEALNAMSWKNIAFYARNIVKLIAQKAQLINCNPSEIQIDCDWTQRNKQLYFALLNAIKAQPYFHDKTLSATIRLHQIKYAQKTGIPPVDKGLLMVYNTEDLTDVNVDNSIISLKVCQQYLKHLSKYPLTLDIALPIYSWALLFNHSTVPGTDRRFKGILRDVRLNDLQNERLFERQNHNRYLIKKDTLYRAYPLKKHELIRFEQADFKTVNQVANYISNQLTQDSLRILLYHCDAETFKRFSTDEMEKIYTDFE